MKFLILGLLCLFIKNTISIVMIKTEYNEKDIVFNTELYEVINATYNNISISGEICTNNSMCINCFLYAHTGEYCSCKHICNNFLNLRRKKFCKANCETYYYRLINLNNEIYFTEI